MIRFIKDSVSVFWLCAGFVELVYLAYFNYDIPLDELIGHLTFSLSGTMWYLKNWEGSR